MNPGAFRFLLAFAVVVFHVNRYVFFGVAAVCIFFFLSGYWISRMYSNKYSKFKQPYKIFIISRIWRLFPVYLFCSAIGYLIIQLGYSPPYYSSLLETVSITDLFSWLFLLGYNLMGQYPLVSAWSLDIELQYYIIAPLIFILTLKKINILLVLSIALSLILLFYDRYGIVAKTLFFYLPFFLFGVYADKVNWKPKRKMLIASYFFIFLFFLVTYTDLLFFHLFMYQKNYIYTDLILAFVTLPVAIDTVYRKSSNIDYVLGGLSYIIYLVHAVIYIPYTFFLPQFLGVAKYLYLGSFIVLSILASIIIYYTIDRTSEASRNKWLTNAKKNG